MIAEQMQRERGIDKHVLAIDIVVMMFAVEPFRSVFDFGEQEGRCDGIERLRLVKRGRRSAAEAHDVGKKFPRSSLREQPLLDLCRVTRNQNDFNFGKSFMES